MKNGLTSYHEVFSVAGSETWTIDTSPTTYPSPDSMQFTYRIRCKKGALYSDYSWELSTFGPSP